MFHFEEIGQETSKRYENCGGKVARERSHMNAERHQLQERVGEEIDHDAHPDDLHNRGLVAQFQNRIDQGVNETESDGKHQISTEMGKLRLVHYIDARQDMVGKKYDEKVEEETLKIIHNRLPFNSTFHLIRTHLSLQDLPRRIPFPPDEMDRWVFSRISLQLQHYLLAAYLLMPGLQCPSDDPGPPQ